MDPRVKPAGTAVDGERRFKSTGSRCSGEVIMEIVVTAIVALVIGVLAGSIAGFRFADYLNDRQKLKLLGVDTDSERAIRWLIALMVLLLRSARHCLDGRGFSEAVIPTLCPLPKSGEWFIGAGSRDPAIGADQWTTT